MIDLFSYFVSLLFFLDNLQVAEVHQATKPISYLRRSTHMTDPSIKRIVKGYSLLQVIQPFRGPIA